MTTAAPPPPEPRSHRRRGGRVAGRWIKRGVVAALAIGAIGAIVWAWLPRALAVDVAVARRMPLSVEVSEDGRTRVRDRFVVTAPISGNLERVALEAGTIVRANDVIARIAPPDQASLDARTRAEADARLRGALARQRQAATTIARARSAYESAARDAERARTLVAREAITAVEREHADVAEQVAREDVAAAELAREAASADVAAARALLAGGTTGGATIDVRAPVGGSVLRLVRDSAGPIAAGAPIVELGDASSLEVVVDVLSSDAAQIATGMAVALDAWGGERALPGHVRVVEPSAFTKISALGVEEQRVNVIVAFDGAPPPSLRDGFRVEAHVITWRGDEVVAIPASAVFRERGEWAVYVVEDGRAHLRAIQIGHRGRNDVEVTGGIAVGARVIIHPSDRVGDGVRVAPVLDTEPTNAVANATR